MRCEEHGPTRATQPLEQAYELLATNRVETRRHFVKHENRWIAEQRDRQREPLFHSARKFANALVRMHGQAHALERVLGLRLRKSFQACEETHRLANTEVVVEADFLRHIADEHAGGLSFAQDIVTADGDATAVAQQADHAANERGLARAVGAPKRDALTSANAQTRVVNGRRAPELPRDIFDIDHGIAP